MTRKNRKPAAKPAPRTIDVELTAGDFAGWSCTARADFPSSVVADLESKQLDRILRALDRIIIDHNFPDADGNLAATMADVDPYRGLFAIAGEVFDRLGKLPNR